MSALLRDLSFTLRLLARRPGFTFAAVVTMALGIASATIVFSIADTLVVHPYAALPQHERIAWLFETEGKLDLDHDVVAPANYLDWKAQARSFDRMGLVGGRSFEASVSGHPRRLQGTSVSPDFFEMIGVSLQVGAGFPRDADQAGHEHVVVISDRLWGEQFARRPDVIGQTLTLDKESWTVVGVLPPRVTFLKGPNDLYVPYVLPNGSLTERAKASVDVVGRLREGVTLEQANAELRTIADRLATSYAATNHGKSAEAFPIDSMFVGMLRTPVYVLLAAVSFVLLIGCANVSNLLLASATVRHREAAVRRPRGDSGPPSATDAHRVRGAVLHGRRARVAPRVVGCRCARARTPGGHHLRGSASGRHQPEP